MEVISDQLIVKNLENVNLFSLVPKRNADFNKDLFTILNILQEYCLRGGIQYTYTSEVKDDQGKVIELKIKNSTTKAIYQPSQTIKTNEFIFDEALKLIA